MAWTTKEVGKLKELAAGGQHYYAEIARELGKNPASVRWKAHQLGLPKCSKAYGVWNIKHKHMQEDVMRYFLDHSAEETMKAFKLTYSEFKSLMTSGYRVPNLAHLRKDTRNRTPWSAKELKFLLRHSGLRPRWWIAEQIKRGNAVCMKERLQLLGVASRSVNGITISQFRVAFGKDPEFCLRTDAGPNKGRVDSHFKIIPWVWLDSEIKAGRLKTSSAFTQLISSMAVFQEWIFEGDALKKMKAIVRKITLK